MRATGSLAPRERWLVVSDLHLSTAQSAHADAFAAFLEALARLQPRRQRVGSPAGTHLLLLGDVLELLERPRCTANGTAAARAVERARCILRAQTPIVDALGRLLRAGVHVHWVAGNHDLDVLRPQVQGVIGAAVAAGAGPDGWSCGLSFHPWFLYRPGVLFAEHGSQHHEINRQPDPLAPVVADGTIFAPAAAWLSAARAASTPAQAGRAALAAVGALRQGGRTTLGDRAHPDDRLASALASLHEASAVTAGRALAAPVLRRIRRAASSQYLRAGALRGAEVLDRHGIDAPLLVYGHAHDVAVEPLPGTSRRYANCGTWSPHAQGTQWALHGQQGCPFLDIAREPSGEVSVWVRWWNEEGSVMDGQDRLGLTVGRSYVDGAAHA